MDRRASGRRQSVEKAPPRQGSHAERVQDVRRNRVARKSRTIDGGPGILCEPTTSRSASQRSVANDDDVECLAQGDFLGFVSILRRRRGRLWSGALSAIRSARSSAWGCRQEDRRCSARSDAEAIRSASWPLLRLRAASRGHGGPRSGWSEPDAREVAVRNRRHRELLHECRRRGLYARRAGTIEVVGFERMPLFAHRDAALQIESALSPELRMRAPVGCARKFDNARPNSGAG